MNTTATIAGKLGVNPFVIFDQDTDEVIMLINYFLRLGENAKERPAPAAAVNDKEESAAFWAAL